MSNKKVKAYIPERLEDFANTLQQFRQKAEKERCYFRININGLKKAIEILPKADRENIERYWGLTGGVNHSKKRITDKDIALKQMQYSAITSMKKLFKLDYVIIYDEYIKVVINKIIRKINRDGVQICELDAVKYLVAFIIVLLNGPKFSFENDNLTIETGCNDNFEYDEYSVVCQINKQLEQVPDNSINLKLLIDWVDCLDFKDGLTIKKSFNIKIPKEYQMEELENLKRFIEIRNFKARVFQYGSWDLTSALILEGAKSEIKLAEFLKELDKIRKNWSIIEEYKTSQIALRTITGLRNLDVYKIGGLEFTDPDEVRFLYLARNIIAS